MTSKQLQLTICRHHNLLASVNHVFSGNKCTEENAHTLPSIALTAFSASACDEYLTKPNPFILPVWRSLISRAALDKIPKATSNWNTAILIQLIYCHKTKHQFSLRNNYKDWLQVEKILRQVYNSTDNVPSFTLPNVEKTLLSSSSVV